MAHNPAHKGYVVNTPLHQFCNVPQQYVLQQGRWEASGINPNSLVYRMNIHGNRRTMACTGGDQAQRE